MAETFAAALKHLREARGLSLRDLGKRTRYSHQYMWDLEHGRRQLLPDVAAALDTALSAGGALVALVAAPATAGSCDDELDAYELANRVAASDVSAATLDGLERAFDRLAVGYQGNPPAALLPDLRRYLAYVGRLVDQRATLTQRRRLLTVGGWLSLLAATVHIDLHDPPAANARLATAASLADHAGDREISAWCIETQAWDALTEGDNRLAVDLSQAAQHVAPRDGSAYIQATAQEGRAWARLGDARQTRAALHRVARLVSPLPQPDRPEHHYRYDPAKQVAYTVTTLSWIADPAAEGMAREVVARLESGADGGPRPRRAASARLDLALALASAGRADEAAGEALAALGSGRIVPSNAWRAASVLTAVERRGLPAAAELRDAVRAVSAT